MLPAEIQDLLALAQISNIAYTDDPSKQLAQFAALNFQTLGRYEGPDHRALLIRNNDRHVLALCGTRFSDANVHELFDDEDVLPVDLGDGRRVMQGFHRGMADLAAWAFGLTDAVLEVTGHSLGGARSHLMPLFAPAERMGQITSFAAPKAANRAYWATCPAIRRVVNARDLWAGYLWLGEWCQPDAMLWLGNGALTPMTESQWIGGIRASDHSITDGYIAALQKLAAA